MFPCSPPGGAVLQVVGSGRAGTAVLSDGSACGNAEECADLLHPRTRDYSKSSLITRSFSPVTKEVVSMGTGTKCIGQSKMRKSGKPTLGLNIACLGSFGNGVHVALSSPLQGQGVIFLRSLTFQFTLTVTGSSWKDRTHLKNGTNQWKQRLPGAHFLSGLKVGQYFQVQTRSSLGLANFQYLWKPRKQSWFRLHQKEYGNSLEIWHVHLLLPVSRGLLQFASPILLALPPVCEEVAQGPLWIEFHGNSMYQHEPKCGTRAQKIWTFVLQIKISL